jgi:hypothetical protein
MLLSLFLSLIVVVVVVVVVVVTHISVPPYIQSFSLPQV